MTFWKSATASALVLLIPMTASACAQRARYHADYFETAAAADAVASLQLPQASVDGGAAIAMSRAAESVITTANPTSFSGSATKIAFPLALIVKQAAAASFADVMSEGAITTSERQAPAGQDYVVTPSVTDFSYSYDFADDEITPRVSLAVRLLVTDAAGRLILDKEYRQNDFGDARHASPAAAPEDVNRTLHALARKLMAQAASDFAAEVAAGN